MMVALPLGGGMSMYHAHSEGLAYKKGAIEDREFVDSLLQLKALTKGRLPDNVKAILKEFDVAHTDENGVVSKTTSYVNPETGKKEVDWNKLNNRLQRVGLSGDRLQISRQTVLNDDHLNWHRNVQEALFADV